MGKVFMSGIVPQKVAPVTFKSNFADNDWSTIIKACQTNKVPDTWTVGSQKTMTINGTDYQIDIIGKNHDTYSDGSGTAPLTFQMHDCYNNHGFKMRTYNDNSCGWGQSDMRMTHLPSVVPLMPQEVQAGLRTVNKLTSQSGSSSTIVTTEDKLFLLSEVEVFGYTKYSHSGEGSQYAYYAAGNSTKKDCGSYYSWLHRSPYANHSYFFTATNYQSGSPDGCPAMNITGISFAFCF